MGRVAPVAISVVSAHLQALLGFSADKAGVVAVPPQAQLPARGQYDASKLLTALQTDLSPGRLRVAVTGLDICLPILTYVFGEALVGGRVAVVSTARLSTGDLDEQPGSPRSLERLAKVALHEAAHALGLSHCRRSGCLMMFSAGLKRLDELHPRFCRVCSHELVSLRRELGT